MASALELTILVLGLIGSGIATVCYLPGVVRVFKTKNTVSISAWQYILTSSGCLLWVIIAILDFIYSYCFGSPNNLYAAFMLALPIMISNLGLGTCAVAILVMKLRNVHHAKKLNLTENKYIEKNKNK